MAGLIKRTSTPQPGIVADYYAPSFAIEIEDQKLGPETLGNVLEVKVDMALGSPAHFELVLDNWDDRRVDFKSIDSAGKKNRPLLDLGQRVLIKMGYADRLLPMVRGAVTALSPCFPESGPRTLAVSGLDGMFDLIGQARTATYKNKADWEIAQEVATRNGFLRTRVTKEGPKHKEVVQQGQDDANFLYTRAQRIGFDFFVRTGPAIDEEETLFFVKSESCDTSKAPVYVFEWGKNLIRFHPNLDISEQVGEVLVIDQDPDAKNRPFRGRARAEDLPSGGGRNGPAVVEAVDKGKQRLVENEKVASQEEANHLAVSLLRERAYQYSTGSGQVIGFPDLRPGDNVQIRGVGARFGGCYQVSQVGHTINASGYFTTFDVRRVHDGGTGA